MILTLLTAFAADVDIERARVALRENRIDAALTTVRSQLADDGDAWTLYLQSCEAAGIGPACEQEARVHGGIATLAALRLRRLAGEEPSAPEGSDPTWSALVQNQPADHPLSWEERAGALARNDPNAGVALALDGYEAHPEHPEILASVFTADRAAAPALGKLAAKASKWGGKKVPKAPAAEVYRWLRVALAIDDDQLAARCVDRLAQLEEPRVRPRSPATPAVRVELAGAAEQGTPVPTFDPEEHQLVTRALVASLLEKGEDEKAIDAVTKARGAMDHLELALLQADLLQASPAAIEAAEQALQLALITPDDRAAAGLPAVQRRMARALAARGKARLSNDDFEGAAVDLMLANQVSHEPIEAGALEEAMKRGLSTLRSHKESLETARLGAHERGLPMASQAAEKGEVDRAQQLLSQVIAALCVPASSHVNLMARLPGKVFIAEALAMRGQLPSRDAADARIDLTLAILLRPFDAPPEWWSALAAHQPEDAAFFALAMADALGGAVELPPWNGDPATSRAAAAALVSRWMRQAPPLDGSGPKISRGVVLDTRARTGRAEPALGQGFPSFEIETEHGTVGLRQGRIAMLVFFRSDSPSSRRAMHDLSVLARDLRKIVGADVITVGIAIDPEEQVMRANLPNHITTMWGPYGWAPELGERFGVEAVPTTFIVDAHGVARFKHVGYLGTIEYVAELRLLTGN